jgi:hypothetical protein
MRSIFRFETVLIGTLLFAASCGVAMEDNVVGIEGLRTMVSHRQSKTLIARSENALAKCMNLSGFNYQPVDPVAVGRELFDGPLDGIDDRSFRSAHGYGISEVFLRMKTAHDPNDKFASSGGTPWQSSFSNCRRSSYKSYEQRAFLVAKVFDIFSAQVRKVQLSPEYLALDRAWSQCIGRSGVNATSSDSLRGQVSSRATAGAITKEEEVAIALADFDCEAPQKKPRSAMLAGIEASVFNENKETIEAIQRLSQ